MKSTGRKAFDRNWRLAQAAAKRPRAGCALTCVAMAALCLLPVLVAGVVL
jgi:hypothetical protein